MPFQSFVQLLAVLGVIGIGAWLLMRPERTAEPATVAGLAEPVSFVADTLPTCPAASASTSLRQAMSIRLAGLGEEGTPEEIATRLFLDDIAETAFNEDAQRRSCTAAVTVGEPGTLGNGYAVSFDVAWTDEDEGEWAATLLALARTTLPTCDNESVLHMVRQNIAMNLGGTATSETARDVIAKGIVFSGVGQTAFDADAQRRNCRASVAMTFQGEIIESLRTATWLVHWGNRASGTVLIEVQF